MVPICGCLFQYDYIGGCGGVDNTRCIAVGFCRGSSRNVTSPGAQRVAHHPRCATQGCSRAGGLLWGVRRGCWTQTRGDREAGVGGGGQNRLGENWDHGDNFDSVP